MENSIDTQMIVALLALVGSITFGIGVLIGFYFGYRHRDHEEDEMLRKWRDDHEGIAR